MITGLFFGIAVPAYAEEGSEGHALSDRVAKAHQSGVDFQKVSLFAPGNAAKHPALLEKETILDLLGEQVSDLYQSHPEAITLTVRSDEGREYTLEMLRSHPTAENANMGYIDMSGRHRFAYEEGLHYQGSVTGSVRSLAAISVFASGDVMLLFTNEEGNFVVGKLEDGSGKYILYNDKHMRDRPYSPCGTSDDGIESHPEGLPGAKTTMPMLCNKVQLYWEVTYNLYVNKSSSLSTTQAYVTGLFNQFQAMYANEKIAVELKSMYVWVAQDDYSATSSKAAMDSFQGYWNGLGNGFDGDVAHLVARSNNGNGGLAYVDILCNRANAYGYSDIHGTYNSVPTFSWDVEVLTHESGHNFGSKHTHWCGWMTGAGSTCGSIDNCTTQEAGTSCSTCGATNLNSAPTSGAGSWMGTVMSYCHLVARGINLANGFGLLPGNKIRTEVSGGSCLSSMLSARLSASPICGTGGVTLTYPANNFGTAPYVYNWSNNSHTQNLTGLSTPGAYSVQIIDSNGCQAGYSVDVIRRPVPGNGITPAQKMPICCANTTAALTLKATVPQDVTGCESVYWLRSATAPGTYAVAKAMFDTAAAANILTSTNGSTISTTEGAILDVHPPSSCTGKLTYYYTPISVYLPKAVHNINATAGGSAAFQRFSTTIGRSVTLPDETSSPTACDLLDTPTTANISVTVSNYTGRTNKMRIVVQDAAGLVIYERFGIAGNGTYSIPSYAMSGNILQALKIVVFDYNCNLSTCTGSTVAVSAVRSVVYGARAASASAGCTIGTSIKVEFAPSGCTKLDVESTSTAMAEAAELFPNPTSGTATLKFTTTSTARISLKITDMLGKTVLLREDTYNPGRHQQSLDVRSWAKGVYFLNIANAQTSAERLKLVVE